MGSAFATGAADQVAAMARRARQGPDAFIVLAVSDATANPTRWRRIIVIALPARWLSPPTMCGAKPFLLPMSVPRLAYERTAALITSQPLRLADTLKSHALRHRDRFTRALEEMTICEREKAHADHSEQRPSQAQTRRDYRVHRAA